MATPKENWNGLINVKMFLGRCIFCSAPEENHSPRHPFANHACPSTYVIVDGKSQARTHEEFMRMKQLFEAGYEAGRASTRYTTESDDPTFRLGWVEGDVASDYAANPGSDREIY